MTLAEFLNALFEHGRLATSAAAITPEDRRLARAVLADFETSFRADLPAQPPEFSTDAALWAAEVMYRGCHFCVDRDADEKRLAETLLAPCPLPPSASVHYSADLVLRFLPELIKLARSAAPDDPLVGVLLKLAAQWPLSSVGVTDVQPVAAAMILEDSCLSRVYIDRIIARKDVSRLKNEAVRELVAAAFGMYPELAADVAAELERLQNEETPS